MIIWPWGFFYRRVARLKERTKRATGSPGALTGQPAGGPTHRAVPPAPQSINSLRTDSIRLGSGGGGGFM